MLLPPMENLKNTPFQLLTHRSYAIRKIQPATTKNDACFFSYQTEALEIAYDRIADDPKITHHLSLQVDEYGNITKELTAAYARRNTTPGIHNLQGRDYITAGLHAFLNINTQEKQQTGILFESKDSEIVTADNYLTPPRR